MTTDSSTDEIRISEYDRRNVGFVMRTGTWWGANLLRLIAKSDSKHRAALRRTFPSYVDAFDAWQDGEPS